MQPAMLSVTVARGSRGCAQPRLIMILSRERYPCALESTCDIESMLGVAREEVLASPQAPERLTLSVHPRSPSVPAAAGVSMRVARTRPE